MVLEDRGNNNNRDNKGRVFVDCEYMLNDL